jgi:hypothetical protein
MRNLQIPSMYDIEFGIFLAILIRLSVIISKTKIILNIKNILKKKSYFLTTFIIVNGILCLRYNISFYLEKYN